MRSKNPPAPCWFRAQNSPRLGKACSNSAFVLETSSVPSPCSWQGLPGAQHPSLHPPRLRRAKPSLTVTSSEERPHGATELHWKWQPGLPALLAPLLCPSDIRRRRQSRRCGPGGEGSLAQGVQCGERKAAGYPVPLGLPLQPKSRGPPSTCWGIFSVLGA